MRNGTCPSCGGNEIYAARNGLGLGEEVYVGLRPHLEHSFRGAAMPHRTREVWSYVCAACGLIEQRLHDDVAMDWVRQSWVRVGPDPGADPAPAA